MIKSSKINKYVTGMVTSLIIIGGTPHVVKAFPIDDFLSRTIRADKLNTINEINEDRLYEVAIKALKEKEEGTSMAGGYITKVNYELKDEKKYLILSLDSIDWMQNISVTVDGREINLIPIDIVKKDASDGKGKEKGKIKFEVGSLDSKIILYMNVQPMGNARVAFRVIPQKDTLKFISDNVQDQTAEKPDTNIKSADQTKPEKPDVDAKPVEQTKLEEPIADGETDNIEKPNANDKKDTLNNKEQKIKVEENSNKANDIKLNTHKRKVVKKIENKDSKNENKDNKTKLPKTGMPIGVTSLGVLGSILVGIGSSLRKNNKRRDRI